MGYGVFVSYSREDEKLVSPVVKLLGAMRKDTVFLDTKDLKLGEEWEPQLMDALDQAGIFIIFWCEHSLKSDFVKKEYSIAVDKKKVIIPVMLDDSPMESTLAKFQGVDLRHFGSHKTVLPPLFDHPVNPITPPPPQKKSFNFKKVMRFLAITIAAFVVLTAIGILITTKIKINGKRLFEILFSSEKYFLGFLTVSSILTSFLINRRRDRVRTTTMRQLPPSNSVQPFQLELARQLNSQIAPYLPKQDN